MRVKDIMSTRPEWIEADASLTTVAKTLRDNEIGCLPVGENDRLVGMITDRDIACRAVAGGLDPQRTTAKDVMSMGVIWCFEDQTDMEALDLMETRRIHHLPVLSREKRIVGMLTMSDLALKSENGLRSEIVHLASRDATRRTTH